MTLEINKETMGFNINVGDYSELSKYIEEAEEVLYHPHTGMWEIDGVKISDEWISEQLITLSHFINVVSHMNFRKGIVAPNNNMAKRLLEIQKGNVPAIKGE